MNKEELELAKQIEQALITSGEHERFKQSLRARLESSGWFEKLHLQVEGELQQRHAAEAGSSTPLSSHLSPQELTSIMMPRALASVPENVKKEVFDEIRRFLDENVRISP